MVLGKVEKGWRGGRKQKSTAPSGSGTEVFKIEEKIVFRRELCKIYKKTFIKLT